MPQDSKAKRRMRRLKRANTLLFRALRETSKELQLAKIVAMSIEKELQAKEKGSLSIRKIEDDPQIVSVEGMDVENHQAD